MSLTLLVALVVIGITAIVVAVHLTGGTTTAVLDGADAAIERFAEDFPDFGVKQVWLAQNQSAAFLALDDGRVGIVAALGDKFLTRIAAAGDPEIRAEREGSTLRLRFDEFTWHGGPFEFASDEDAEAVAALVGHAHREGAEAHG